MEHLSFQPGLSLTVPEFYVTRWLNIVKYVPANYLYIIFVLDPNKKVVETQKGSQL